MGEAEAPLLVLSTAATHDLPVKWAIDPVDQLPIRSVYLPHGRCQSNLTRFISGISRIASGKALTSVKQQVFGEALSLKRESQTLSSLRRECRHGSLNIKSDGFRRETD